MERLVSGKYGLNGLETANAFQNKMCFQSKEQKWAIW